MEDKASKTEDATPKKLKDSKKKGQVAKSADLNGAGSLYVFTIFFVTIANHLFKNTYNYIETSLARVPNENITEAFFKKYISRGSDRGHDHLASLLWNSYIGWYSNKHGSSRIYIYY